MFLFDLNPENAPLTQGSTLTQNGETLVQRKSSFPYNALDLNGTTQSAQVSGFKLLGAETLSVCCSFKAAPNEAGMLVCRQNDDGIQWSSWVSNNKVYVQLQNGSNGRRLETTSSNLTDSTWKHVVFSIFQDNTCQMFVNGSSETMIINYSSGSLTGITFPISTPMSIGYRTYPGYQTYLQGQIAFAGIAYGQDLTLNAAELYTKKTWDEFSPSLQAKFVAFYELSNWKGHFGKEYIDRAGKNGPLVPSGSPTFTGTGAEIIDSGKDHDYLYNAATLDGTNDYFSVPSTSTFDMSGDFTLNCWLKTSNEIDPVYLLDKTSGAYCQIVLKATSRNTVDIWASGSSPNPLSLVMPSSCTSGSWHMLSVRRSSGVVTAYIDASEGTPSAAYTYDLTRTAQLNIGGSTADSSYPDIKLAFWSFHTRALSGTQITELYRSGSHTTWADLSPSFKVGCIAFYELSNWHGHTDFELIDRAGISGALAAVGGPTYTPAGATVLDNYNGYEVPYYVKMQASHGIDNLQGRQSTVTAVGGISANGPTLNGYPTWLFDNVDDGIKITGSDTVGVFNGTEWHVFAVFKHLTAESFGPLFTVSNLVTAYTGTGYSGLNPRDTDIVNTNTGLFLSNSSVSAHQTLNDSTDIGDGWHIVHVFRRGRTAGFSYDDGPEVTYIPSSMYAEYDTFGIACLFRQTDGVNGNNFANLNVADLRVAGFLTERQEKAVYQDLKQRYFESAPIPSSARVLWQIGDLVDRSQSNASPLIEGVAPTPVDTNAPNPGLYFNGTNQTTRWLISGLSTFDHHDFTVFLVANSTTNISDGGISWSMGNASQSVQFYVANSLYSSRAMLQAETPSGNQYGNGSQVVTAGKTHVYRFRVTPTTLYLSVDGQVEVSLAANVAGQSAMTRIGLACQATPTPVYFDELTVYEHSVIKNAGVTMDQLQRESLRLVNKYKEIKTAPMMIPSLGLWVSADKGFTDQSQSQATMVNVGDVPIVQNALNGYPVFTFNGSSQRLQTENSALLAEITQAGDFEIFIVGKVDVENAWPALVGITATSSYHITAYPQGSVDGVYIAYGSSPNTQFRDTTADVYSKFGIVRARQSGGATSLQVDNNAIISTNSGGSNSIPTSMLRINIGGMSYVAGGATYSLNGKIAEVLIFKEALTQYQRSSVYTYLKTKYNI